MNNHGLNKENFLRSLPVSLSGDPKMVALAGAIAAALEQRREEIRRASVYPHISQLDEGLLDILARDFKVDWWDPDYTLEEKRRTLATSWQVHKTLGTRKAVETALRAIYPDSEAEPWYEYGGEPYHFRLKINLTREQYEEGKPQRALDQVKYYKSLRDHLDSLSYTITLPDCVLHVGGRAGRGTVLGVPPGADRYDYRQTLRAGLVSGIRSTTGVPEASTAPPASVSILRTGGVCTILSNIPIGE